MCFFIARLKIEEEEEEDSLLEKLSLTTFADLAANRFAALLNMSFVYYRDALLRKSTRALLNAFFFKQTTRNTYYGEQNSAEKNNDRLALSL